MAILDQDMDMVMATTTAITATAITMEGTKTIMGVAMSYWAGSSSAASSDTSSLGITTTIAAAQPITTPIIDTTNILPPAATIGVRSIPNTRCPATSVLATCKGVTKNGCCKI